MKGIILAGGTGSRLFPVTLSTSKQLLPIYDKPMIYYPISVLMQAGISDILIITTEHDLSRFQSLLGDGSEWGVSISYKTQKKPEGIAQVFLIAEDYIGDDKVCLTLGDNIFYGEGFSSILQSAKNFGSGGVVFGYEVKSPERYGVIDFAPNGSVKAIVEKPKKPPSHFAVTGLYFYDSQVVSFAKRLKPSWRGELEITDINQMYLDQGQLQVQILDRGFAWLDTGTADALLKASSYVQMIQERQGTMIGCLEEEAIKQGWLNPEDVLEISKKYNSSAYAVYLERIAEESSKGKIKSLLSELSIT